MRVIILAAGPGRRMQSGLPKALHPLCGRPLAGWAVEAARPLDSRPIIVVGHEKEQVMAALGEAAECAVQKEPPGTGHAVQAALPFIEGEDRVLVMAGDMPLLGAETLKALADALDTGAAAAILTTRLQDPAGCGRVVRDASGTVRAIAQEGEAGPETAPMTEVSLLACAFDAAALRQGLESLTCPDAQGGCELPDIINALIKSGGTVAAVACPAEEALDVNDRAQLARAAAILRHRINEEHMRGGVTLIDPERTYIDAGVTIGPDTLIYPGNILEGATRVGRGCTLYADNRLKDTVLGDGVVAESSVFLQARVADNTTVGPHAYLRPGSDVGPGCRIGDFVEIKNSKIGANTHIAHLTYVGDADVGSDVNIGCGTVFVNYDGISKHRSIVGDGAFIGCNTNLVAPVTVGERAFTAAGSTITGDVPAGALAIARSRQVNKPGWVENRKKKQ